MATAPTPAITQIQLTPLDLRRRLVARRFALPLLICFNRYSAQAHA